jgi:stearoyl-CoA desaturase (delta-9 desaturase)
MRTPGFLLMHVGCVLVIWTGVSWIAVATCAALYVVRSIGITAGYHRYFSHRTYGTSRFFQFILALLGTSAAQQGPMWWAAHHRYHHKFSDTDEDVHSPSVQGLWWSHMGWILAEENQRTRYELVPDLMKFPELRFLDRFYLLPPIALAISIWITGRILEVYSPELGTSGFQLLVWGFFVGTVLLYHATFSVNSLTHIFGRRRFQTKDNSRNFWPVALLTMGEGWHNNHHYCPSSERHGFRWWEIDVSHYVLRVLSWMRVVWDLRTPPRLLDDRTGRHGVSTLVKSAESVQP